MVEHPADSGHGYPAIWKLREIIRLLGLPGLDRIAFKQGPLGQVSPKPTMLLTCKLPSLLQCVADCELPANQQRFAPLEVRDASGAFAIAATKTYPPRMCAGIILSAWRTLAAQVVDHRTLLDQYDLVRNALIGRCIEVEQGGADPLPVSLPPSADEQLHELARWPDEHAGIGPDFNVAARARAAE